MADDRERIAEPGYDRVRTDAAPGVVSVGVRIGSRPGGRSVSGDGLLEPLSLVSLLSLCCIGFGGLAGGGASASGFATGATRARVALISGSPRS